MRIKCFNIVTLLAVLILAGSQAFAAPIDDLEAHLDTFITNNFPGEMSYTATEHETISGSSNLTALANLIADNYWVINQTATVHEDLTGTAYVQLSGEGKQQFIDDILMPKMIVDALVAQVDWSWNGQDITTYALVAPGPNSVGDTENIMDGVAGIYTIPEPGGLRADNPFHQGFENGFGTHVADYNASLECFNGDTCSGDATCNESRPGMSCDKRRNVKCLPNGNCQMDVAFVGYGAVPSVKFKAKDYEFEVSGWGWEYYNASITLNENCECNPANHVALIEPDPNVIPVGGETQMAALVQGDTGPHPEVGVIFTRLEGAFTFTEGDVSGDGSETIVYTDESGWAGMSMVGDAPGPCFIEVFVPGPELIQIASFQVIENPCPADLTHDGQVTIEDIFEVLGLWGECPPPCPPFCPGDLTEDCIVNIDDIFAILGQWGPCE